MNSIEIRIARVAGRIYGTSSGLLEIAGGFAQEVRKSAGMFEKAGKDLFDPNSYSLKPDFKTPKKTTSDVLQVGEATKPESYIVYVSKERPPGLPTSAGPGDSGSGCDLPDNWRHDRKAA